MEEQMLDEFKCPHGFVENYEDCKHKPDKECTQCKCWQSISVEKFYLAMLLDKYGTDCLWISVKDRLPGEKDYHACSESYDGAVLWWNGKVVGFGWYYRSTGTWANLYDASIEAVTHWMPLPEPPKEDE